MLALGAMAVLLAAGWLLQAGLSPARLTLVTAGIATATAAAAALLAMFAARLTPDQHLGWVSTAIGCFSLFAIPTFAIAVLDPVPPVIAVRLLADGLVAGLLLTAAIAPPRLTRRGVWSAPLGTAAAVLGAAALGAIYPSVVDVVSASVSIPLGVAALWTASGIGLALRARWRTRGLRWVGTGFALLGVARVVDQASFVQPVLDVAAALTGLRLVALALVLSGALRLALQALDRFEGEHDSLEEELRLAETRLARTAERDHELRTGLAGLAGATTLLGGDCPDPERLGTAVAAELDRLDDLLQTPVGSECEASSTSYAVAPVLHGLITLRRSAGMTIDQELQLGLRALGSSARLAQVVTNLFANVERHAPGSPVQVTAERCDGRVVIRVRDWGPGLPAGTEEAVIEPGVRDSARGGLGLGLHVCRRLLAAENGIITLQEPGPEEVGCLAVVDLPAAPTDRVQRPSTGSDLRGVA